MKILFDGSYLFYKSVFANSKISANNGAEYNENNKFGDNLKEQDTVIVSMLHEIQHMIEKFKNEFDISGIVWCMDGDSWRKKIYPEYKAHRKKADNINWEKLYKAHEQLGEILKEHGIIVCREQNFEVDDIMALLTYKYKNENEDFIIYSSDSDLSQLLYYTDNNIGFQYYSTLSQENFTFIDKVEQDIEKLQSCDDIFDFENNLNYTNKVIPKIIKFLKTDSKNDTFISTFNYINPKEVKINKILLGDRSDNINSIVNWKCPSTGNNKNFTDNMLSKVLNDFNLTKLELTEKIFEDKKFREDFLTACIEKANPKGTSYTYDDALSNFKRNIKICVLHRENIPSDYDKSVDFVNKLLTETPKPSFTSIINEKSNKISKAFSSEIEDDLFNSL